MAGTQNIQLSDTKTKFDSQTVEDGLLRVSEVAKFLGLARSTVYQLMDRGELPYAKIGRARRIPFNAVIAFSNRSLVEGNPTSETIAAGGSQ